MSSVLYADHHLDILQRMGLANQPGLVSVPEQPRRLEWRPRDDRVANQSAERRSRGGRGETIPRSQTTGGRTSTAMRLLPV
jgi:hypothetical protein